MIQISVSQARQRWSELIRLVEAGQAIEVTRRGKPVARIVPPQPARGRKLPDLTAFRESLKMSGKPMSQTISELRRQERY